MSKYTPGPWSEDHERVMDSRGRVVALVTYGDGTPVDWPILTSDGVTDEDREAEDNQRLIAAAPELVEALRAALAMEGFAGPIGSASRDAHRPTFDKIRSALAKAGVK